MLRHNFLISLRNFRRYKTSFFINFIGLSTGLACVLFIYLWVNDELNVDKFHMRDKQLYQVMKNNVTTQEIKTGEDTPGLLARSLKEEMPEVENAVSVFPPADYTFKGAITKGKTIVKATSKFADTEFFNIFSYPLRQGAAPDLLADNSSVVISDQLAAKLFPGVYNVVGKTILWEGERLNGEFKIAGVFQSSPYNATIQFDILFSYELMLEKFSNFLNWGNSGPSTYIVLRDGTDTEAFDNKIADFVKEKLPTSSLTLFIRHYSERYLYGNYVNGKQTGGRIEYVRLFSIVALFILVIACVNFMNLSTARASRRLKEVGVKKAVGASRNSLIFQFLSESILLTFFSLCFAIVIVLLLLNQFNEITAKQLTIDLNAELLISLLAITLFTGLIAGSYPAFFLSGFNPNSIFKGGTGILKGFGKVWTRKGLVVFQFTISIILIVSVIVVYEQMGFIKSKNLGYNRDNLITLHSEGNVSKEPEIFFSEIKKISGVLNVTSMHGDLLGLHGGTTDLSWEGKTPESQIDFDIIGVGYDLAETLGLKMKEGRDFSRDYQAENDKIIFNEIAIERMGLTDPIGKKVMLWGSEKEIIGVVENFHFESLYEDVKPIFINFTPNAETLLIKIQAGTEQETLSRLKTFYQEVNPGYSFDYKFLDQDFQLLYAAEQSVSVLSKYFAALAIIISCLGLFGLVAFTAERRLKEIGVRKVFGASELHITYLLSSSFTQMVLIAIVIAIPLSRYIASKWLESFAYKIELEWWYFASAGLSSLLIAWLAVFIQAFKAINVKPVNCLRDE
ncbi:MAG: transporter permease [Thalassobius sp.]|nr:transporter permease [Thalassovita sp.]